MATTAAHNQDMSDKRIRVLPLNTEARANEVKLVQQKEKPLTDPNESKSET